MRVGDTGVGEMGVGETGQIIGETGVGETGVGEMGVNRTTRFVFDLVINPEARACYDAAHL